MARSGYRPRNAPVGPGVGTYSGGPGPGHPPIAGLVADARQTPEPDQAYDATLLLGPLHQLLERHERATALTEAVQVTRPGGRVVGPAISRFAEPLDFAAMGRWRLILWTGPTSCSPTGRNSAELGFTQVYFHPVDEVADECRHVGLHQFVVHGAEGAAQTAAETAAAPVAETVFTATLNPMDVYSSKPGPRRRQCPPACHRHR